MCSFGRVVPPTIKKTYKNITRIKIYINTKMFSMYKFLHRDDYCSLFQTTFKNNFKALTNRQLTV